MSASSLPRPEAHTILIVDDTPANLGVVVESLEEQGFRVTIAQDGREGLQRAEFVQPDLILLDVMMPGLDGFEVCRRLKARDGTRNIPVIFMTALADTDDKITGFRVGGVDYVTKPLQIDEVVARVNTHLKLRAMQQQLEAQNAQLQREILERRQAEAALRGIHEQLEERVSQRTAELDRANASLRRADRRKDEFLALLSHELRNPLAPIRTALEILRLDGSMAPASQKACGIIERQLRQMVRLVSDLLDVSRITQGKLELRKEPVELSTIVDLAVETARPLLDEAQDVLTVTLPAEPIILHGDATRLAQALSNLLNNASKYTAHGGRIWLRAERQDGNVLVSIRDEGIGIDAGMLPHIFDMFAQIDQRGGKVLDGGLGVGLALVRSLVDMHGGTVEARSGGHDRGSEFVLRLPVLTDAQAPDPAPSGAIHPPTSAQRKLRILVVDDNEDITSSLELFLQMIGHEVCTAGDGLEAISAAEAFRPDVILLDIGLPKLNGCDAARRIRAYPWGKDILLVALTGWGQQDDRQRSAEAGFDHHLVKPVGTDVLEELLTNAVPK